MKLYLTRKWFNKDYTIGQLYTANGDYICDTLEDKDRGLTDDMSEEEIKSKKIYGETAIPKGTYEVIINYSNKFKKKLPLLLNVKGYEGIRIHVGNSNCDTLGCILVGENKLKGMVINSTSTMKKVMQLLINANSPITITIN